MTTPDTTAARKPEPVPEPDDLPHWDALAEGRLVLPRCTNCGNLVRRAVMLCPACRGEEFEWSEVSGRATVYTFTVVRQSWIAGFGNEIPYVVVAVALVEQPSLLLTTNLVGDYDVNALDVGQSVEAVFERRGGRTLLQFRLASAVAGRDADVR